MPCLCRARARLRPTPLAQRDTLLLQALPFLPKVEDDELLFFIERHSLMRRGLGFLDIHLLACACLSDTVLWTMDKKLRQAAKDLRRAVVPFKLSSSAYAQFKTHRSMCRHERSL